MQGCARQELHSQHPAQRFRWFDGLNPIRTHGCIPFLLLNAHKPKLFFPKRLPVRRRQNYQARENKNFRLKGHCYLRSVLPLMNFTL